MINIHCPSIKNNIHPSAFRRPPNIKRSKEKMTDKFKGHIVKWHDEKGFGFIKCQDLSEEIFFHISQYKGRQRPEINEQVVFALGKNRQGKTQALQVQEWLFVRKQQRKREHWQQQQDEFENNRQLFTVCACLVDWKSSDCIAIVVHHIQPDGFYSLCQRQVRCEKKAAGVFLKKHCTCLACLAGGVVHGWRKFGCGINQRKQNSAESIG